MAAKILCHMSVMLLGTILISQGQTASPSPSKYTTCGYSSIGDAGIEGGSIPSPSIVGGWQARSNEFPWQVRLAIVRGSSEVSCGGSIIDKKYILTAAHCIENEVRAGELDTSSQSGQEINLQVSEIIKHENFNRKIGHNDIALLKLAGDGIVDFNDAVQPICMPSKPAADHVGHVVTISGWGSWDATEKLMYTNTKVMQFKECEKCWSGYYAIRYNKKRDKVMDGMVCAGDCAFRQGATTRSGCYGDSGGPMAYKRNNGIWELIGVVSWGDPFCSYAPTVYSDPFFFKEWIREKTFGSNIVFPESKPE